MKTTYITGHDASEVLSVMEKHFGNNVLICMGHATEAGVINAILDLPSTNVIIRQDENQPMQAGLIALLEKHDVMQSVSVFVETPQ